MKKNLKKAISAVMALAVVGSTVPASFAAKVTLTDVADTASYATAVNTLVALGVINGYEDDTFLPDNLITRAEVTKVVVAALNETDTAEGMKGSTQFSDIEAKHEWATGFINAGVQQGFINGMENNTFAPDANVTYAQVVTMLVRALGYEEYAQYMGGYPNGYISIANSEGITSGVKANANDNVTRAQVAQLVYNALKTPIVDNIGMVYSATAGGFVPNIQKMDGSDDTKFKTLLTEKFDAYYVEGYVTATSKTLNTLKSDEVKFGIAKSEKYDENDFLTSASNPALIYKNLSDIPENSKLTVNVGDTNAADYDGSYATAIIAIDQYGDYEFVSFIGSGKNKTETFQADWIDTDSSFIKETKGVYSFDAAKDVKCLEFFTSDSATKSVKYDLKTKKVSDSTPAVPDVKLYVNGAAVEATLANLATYVLNNNVGTVELVDTYKTDGYYDTIYVQSYVTAQVSSVDTDADRLYIKNVYPASAATKDYITLDDEEDDVAFTINYNGQNVTLSELKKNDVISIAYNVNGKLEDSKFFDIYVSRDVKTEKMSGKSAADEVVKFNGEEYSFVRTYDTMMKDTALGNEYTLYLDAFGRIFKMEVDSTSAKYAIVERWTKSSDEYRVTLYTAEGELKTYTFDDDKTVVAANGDKYSASEATNKLSKVAEKLVYTDNTYETKKAPESRVVNYKVSSSTGYITELTFLSVNATSTKSDEYRERTNAIGGVKMGDATKIVDAIEYAEGTKYASADLGIATVASFKDGVGYKTFAYGDKIDGIYPFVLVTEGANNYGVDTRFAVVSGAVNEITDKNSAEVYEIPVWYKGTEQALLVDEDATAANNLAKTLKKGDVIIFTTNANSYVKEILKLSAWGDVAYSTIKGLGLGETDEYDAINQTALKTAEFEMDYTKHGSEEVQVVFGPIYEVSEKEMTIAKIDSNITDLAKTEKDDNGLYSMGLTDDTNAYMYDYSVSSKNALTKTTASNIASKDFEQYYVTTGSEEAEDLKVFDKIDWTKVKGANALVDFAFALVVEGDVVDVLIFKGAN